MERLTPRDIFSKDFKTARKGYNVDEVNEFLDVVIKNFEALLEENLQLKEELKKERKSKLKQGQSLSNSNLPGQPLSNPNLSGQQSMPLPMQDNNDRMVEDLMRRMERLEKYMMGR
ncbi:DivIVA domain-containing protein [Marininema mesophilum]|uniref:DivIVA domain-containing protein n=1 Tax=Marininema mesophilum TaxID=1048340 RepID=A0A1H2QZ50_9BACL|nr:DivIVA domain-containing protein [Marininema mesophilum]SDW12365.1 DivIVA domain-containing protein [Marininema mesophilum]